MRNLLVVTMLLFILVAGCERREPEKTVTVAAVGAPTLDELKNATYSGFDAVAGSVTLVNGQWEGDLLSPGSPMRPRVYCARDFRLVGDVDGDGSDEAVAMLGYTVGGPGELIYIAVMRREAGVPDCVAMAPLGSRVKIRDARVVDGRIVIDALQAGPTDGACCPGDLVTRAWQLTPDGLVEVSTTPTGRLSVATLEGVEWVLRWWDLDEPAPEEPEVTAMFKGIRISGSTGCNTYYSGFRDAPVAGEVLIVEGNVTQVACPDPAAAVEARFLTQLAAVRRYSFMNGMLALDYVLDEQHGTMLFARRPAPEPPQSE